MCLSRMSKHHEGSHSHRDIPSRGLTLPSGYISESQPSKGTSHTNSALHGTVVSGFHCVQEGRSEDAQRAFIVLKALMVRMRSEDLPALVREMLQNVNIRNFLEQAASLGKEPRLPLAIAATIPSPVLHYAHASLEASKKTKVQPCPASCTE